MSSSAITKRAIASAFEELLEVTPLEQITVSAIAERTGINRQTFYYHFHDIYDLLIWIYRNEADQTIGRVESLGDMRCALVNCLRGLRDNRNFVVQTIHRIDTPYAYRFAYDEVSAYTRSFIEVLARGLDISEEDLELVTRFYTVGLVETVYTWVTNGMKEEPERLAGRIMLMLQGTLEGSLDRLSGRAHGRET